MKKQLMKRAWEIFRTLSGDKRAKLKAALKEAWAEMKNACIKEESQFELQQLLGTEKQVAWAESLRKNFVTDMVDFINSDEKFYDTKYTRLTATDIADNYYERGITNGNPSRTSLFFKYCHEAVEKGLNVDEYTNEKFSKIFEPTHFVNLKGKTSVERIRAEKKVLKYVLFETLKLDIRASDWIEAFRNSRYDNEMRRIFNLK